MNILNIDNTLIIPWKIIVSAEQFNYIEQKVFEKTQKNWIDILKQIMTENKDILTRIKIVDFDVYKYDENKLVLVSQRLTKPTIHSLVDSLEDSLKFFTRNYRTMLDYLAKNNIIDPTIIEDGRFISLYNKDKIKIINIDIDLDTDVFTKQIVLFLLYISFDSINFNLSDQKSIDYLETFINPCCLF